MDEGEAMSINNSKEVGTQEHEPQELAIVPAPEPQAVNLFNAPNPAMVLQRATEVAKALAGVILEQGLYNEIQGRRHVRVEGWTLCGSMLGVFPVCVWTRPIEGGWEARVEAVTMNGQSVGAAESQCTRKEKTWANRDDYALRSMAQTRATSKALRLPLGFIIQLAGYNPTPAEEMPTGQEVLITYEQMHTIADLIEDVEADEAKFCAYMGVNKLEDIPASKYQKAVNALNQKRNAK
jgi:hypothetical protein